MIAPHLKIDGGILLESPGSSQHSFVVRGAHFEPFGVFSVLFEI